MVKNIEGGILTALIFSPSCPHFPSKLANFPLLNIYSMETITWNDFEKVRIHAGTIMAAKVFEKARNPAYQLEVDFGPEIGIKRSSAQITKLYNPEELVGRQVVAVINFPVKQIANFFSECLVLGVVGDEQEIVLLQPERPVKNGHRIA